MNEITRKDWIVRIIIGGLCGLALQAVIATFWVSFPLLGSFKFRFAFFTPFGYVDRPWEWLFNLVNTALMFAFGAEVGVATLPFDDEGKKLLWKSLLHFAVMAVTVTAWAWLNFGWLEVPYFLRPLSILYAAVWLLRWLLWYFEFQAIKEKLGLTRKGGGGNG